MKKGIACLLLAALLSVSCFGCGSEEKSNSNLKISRGAQKAATEAIQYVDDFMDFKIEAKEASQKIKDISESFVQTEEKDSNIETEISLCGYAVEDFVDKGYQSDGLDKARATNKLVTERNSLASDSGNSLRELSSNNSKKYNLAELCVNRNLIKYSFVTTTISTKKLFQDEKSYSCSFLLKDNKLLSLCIYTSGFYSDLKDRDYITITGVFDYVKGGDSVALMIYAVNNSFIEEKTNKKLYTNVKKFESKGLLYDIID